MLTKIICAVLGLAAVEQASAFSVFGPAESWQTPAFDYVTRYFYGNSSEMGGPKNYNEGSRINVPIITYGYDSTFLDYFGVQGVKAVDSAMQEMNRLPSASSAKLANFLTQDNQVINYTAEALSLTDLKSTVMGLMLEHMGLIGETHVWDLHARAAMPGGGFQYIVLNRNYDPVTYNPTAYVNGVQYTYSILDGEVPYGGQPPIGVDVADALESPVDLASGNHFVYTAVATGQSLQQGGFYLGITRDDIGGLAYLYKQNRYEYEGVDSNSVVQGMVSPWAPVNTAATNSGTNGFQGLRGGVEKITYLKVAYDSLLGTAFQPLTYTYTIPVVTNGMLYHLTVTRTITQPDILFTAGDLVGPSTAYPLTDSELTRGFNFVSNGVVTVGGGGVTAQVIAPQEIITFNNVTPIYVNESPSFLDQITGSYPWLCWGSFDGTTNTPVVYPNGASYEGLLQEVIGSGGSTFQSQTWSPLSYFNGSTNTSSTVSSP
jgi:hypothetical protein